MRPYHFDLELAIAAWRRSLTFNRTFSGDDLDELEQHLRDQVAGLVAIGTPEEQAYRQALREMGDQGTAETEYRKVYWGKLHRQHRWVDEFYWRGSMIKNYVSIAVRQMRRHKVYTFINVLGLSVSMACCLLVGLYIRDELAFDRFHEKADRLYILTGKGTDHISLSTPYSLATVLGSELPDVAHATRVWGGRDIPILQMDTRNQVDRQVLLTEPSFFKLFTFPTLAGDPEATLAKPDGVILTASSARLLFGSEDPIGRQVSFPPMLNENITFTVGAVVHDPPAASSIQFDVLAPLSLMGPMMLKENEWGFSLLETYVETMNPLDVSTLTERITGVLQPHLGEETEFVFSAYPMAWQHLSGLRANGLTGQSKYLYLFGSVALLVLLIASVNYVNLVTAQAMRRIREVGVRKTLGAFRMQLATQFLVESTLLCLAAFALAGLATAGALPFFNDLVDKQLTAGDLFNGWSLPAWGAALLALTTVAGMYPALYLARFEPMSMLRGAGGAASPSGGRRLRQGLIICQFAISAMLLIATGIIYQQMQYVRQADLGFDGEQVVVIDLPQNMPNASRETLKQRVAAYQGVLSVTLANGTPGRFYLGFNRPAEESAPDTPNTGQTISYHPSSVDYDYIRTFNIPLLAGRDFSQAYPADALNAYILNKTAVQELGWSPAEAVGKTFRLGPPEVPNGEIVGVVEDFHIATLHDPIAPVVLQMHRSGPVGGLPFTLSAKLETGNIPETLAYIEAQYSALAPDFPFAFGFIDDEFDAMYRAEERLSRTITVAAALAIFLACLGLFGLAAFTAERRTKEIGIRKVLGATVSNIALLLSREFLVLATLAFILAIPPAYLLMQNWLSEFAFRISIGPGIFLLAGGLLWAIVLLTIGHRAVRTALADPVESLRYE